MAEHLGFLADLKRRLGEIDAEAAALEAERGEVKGLIVGIERFVQRQVGEPRQVQAFTNERQVARAATHPKTMPEAVLRFTESLVPGPLTTREFRDGVVALGWKDAANLRGHVYNTLERLSREGGPLRRHPDGRWSLKAWNLPEGEHKAKNVNDLLRAE